MTGFRTAVLLAALLAGCAAPGEGVTVLEQSPDLIGLRAAGTEDVELEEAAARHCTRFGKQPALRYYRREGPRGDQVYALFQCL